MRRKIKKIIVIVVAISSIFSYLYFNLNQKELEYSFNGSYYEVVNNNIPYFTEEEKKEARESYEYYGELDYLGRVTYAQASLGVDLMPSEDRESISNIYPSGFNQYTNEEVLGNNYLYNRSHLIAFMLAGENDNENNLITGTSFMNQELMLPLEKVVYNYITNENHHVLYRVTPLYDKNELVATAVLMEAQSIEDDDISFCILVYNVEPCIEIDYSDGEVLNADAECDYTQAKQVDESQYILNTNSLKYHRLNCDDADDIAPFNKEILYANSATARMMGFEPCGNCKP